MCKHLLTAEQWRDSQLVYTSGAHGMLYWLEIPGPHIGRFVTAPLNANRTWSVIELPSVMEKKKM